jgi:hypothetical protein
MMELKVIRVIKVIKVILEYSLNLRKLLFYHRLKIILIPHKRL